MKFHIYHHLGLGDHFICNGLVRELIKDKDEPLLFVKKHNKDTVFQMYEDTNLKLIEVNDDQDVINYVKEGDLGVQIGFHNLNQSDSFDRQFYNLAGIPFEKKWQSFRINRQKKRENSLIYKSNLPEKFALVHEDKSRGFVINKDLINLPIVKVDKMEGFSMIDWLGVADLANEIHVIESSFMSLVDLETKKGGFVHYYARRTTGWMIPTLRNNWSFLD